MINFSLIDLLPSETKQWLFDELIDASAKIGKSLLGNEIGSRIERLKSDRAFNESFIRALQNAGKRWSNEYEDKDVIIYFLDQKEVWRNDKVVKALREIIRRPGEFIDIELDLLVDSFYTGVPEFDKERIKKAIEYLINCLANEVMNLPQLRPLYELQFQKITAKLAQQQLEELKLFRSDLRDTLETISKSSYKQIAEVAIKNLPPQKKIFSNLPNPEHSKLIGRDAEIKILMEHLKPYPESWLGVITIDGVGGVGKSALALELAHYYVREYENLASKDKFDAVIWTSAKHFIPTSSGIVRRSGYSRNLSDIFTEIATTLERTDITKVGDETQINLVRNALATQRSLLIIDNLETIDDELVVSFIHELPPPTKVIVTTRHRLDVAYPIRLTGMSETDSAELVMNEATNKNVTLTSEQLRKIVEYTGGVPLAIVLVVGRMSLGYEMESALDWISRPKGDVANYFFEESIRKIRETPTLNILLSVAILPTGLKRSAAGYIAGLVGKKSVRDDGLAELTQLSLLNKNGEYFSMLPLTRKFTLNELTNKNHETELMIRACQYYSNYFAGQTEKPRWKSYDEIEAERDNLLFAIDYLDELSRNNDLQLETTLLVLQLGEILAPYLLARGHWNDYKRVCIQCIETSNRLNRIDLFVRFSHYLSRYFWHIQDFDNANHWAQAGYDAAKKINDKNSLAVAQHMLGILAIGSGKLALAKELLQEALNNRLEQLGCMGTCAIKEDLGFAFMEAGDLGSAESLLLESYNQQLTSDDQEGQAIDLYYLGLIAEHAGRNLESIKMLSESMILAISVNRATTTANCQHGLARLFEKIDDYENARAMAQSARTLYERLGMQAQAQATAQIIARI